MRKAPTFRSSPETFPLCPPTATASKTSAAPAFAPITSLMPQLIDIAILSDRHFWREGYDKAKLRQVSQAEIVENERLGAVLAFIREQQIARAEPRSKKAPRRRDQSDARLFKVG